jgi:hypothetical protein
MTLRSGLRSVIGMRNGRLTSNGLVIIALTAVFSLATGHLIALGTELLGSGPASTLALVGDIAALLACAVSARFGVRHLRCSRTC